MSNTVTVIPAQCGCKIEGPIMRLCATHKAAPELLEELARCRAELAGVYDFLSGPIKDTARRNSFLASIGERINASAEILAKAEGRVS